jgi:hypothetical protein
MSDQPIHDDELSIEELEDAAGGAAALDAEAGNTNACAGGNCGCPSPQ